MRGDSHYSPLGKGDIAQRSRETKLAVACFPRCQPSPLLNSKNYKKRPAPSDWPVPRRRVAVHNVGAALRSRLSGGTQRLGIRI